MIKNKVNSKIYIGQSYDIGRRWKVHKRELNNNKHKNKHLQSAWNNDGEENFTFDILEECNIKELNEREKHWIANLKSFKREFGYNKTFGGNFGAINDEGRQKISNKLKGRPSPTLGKHWKRSKESNKKVSNSLKGNIPWNKGKKMSDEQKQKLKETIHKNKLNKQTLIEKK